MVRPTVKFNTGFFPPMYYSVGLSMNIHDVKVKDPQVLVCMPTTFSAHPLLASIRHKIICGIHYYVRLLNRGLGMGRLFIGNSLSNLHQINQSKVCKFSAVPVCVDNCCGR